MKSRISTTVTISVMDVDHDFEIEVVKIGPQLYQYTDRITQYPLEGTLDGILQEVRCHRQEKLNQRIDHIKAGVGNIMPSHIGSSLPISASNGQPRMLITCIHDGNQPVYSVQLYSLPVWLSVPFLASGPADIRNKLDRLKKHTDYAPDLEAAFKEFQESWV